MRLRLLEHPRTQWISRLANHPVTGVAALVAVVVVALWSLVTSDLRLIHSPKTAVVFSPR